MARFVLLFFMGPFWIQFAIAAGFGWLTFGAWQSTLELEQARLALIRQPPPAVVAIADFNDSKAPVQEVHLRAAIAVEHNTRLVQKRNFITTDEDLMVVAQDATAGVDEPLVRAVILLEPDQQDQWLDWMQTHAVDMTETGPVVELNGLRAASRNFSHVSDVLRENGLKKAENFTYLEPFLEPRDLALANLPKEDRQAPMWLAGAAAVFALVGFVKLRRSRTRVATATPASAAPVNPAQRAAQIATLKATILSANQPAPQPRRKTISPVVKWLLVIPALLFACAWAVVLLGISRFLPPEAKMELSDFLPMIVVSSVLIFLPLSAFLALRNSVRGLAPFLPSRAKPSLPPAPLKTDTLIQTIPNMRQTIAGLAVPQKLLAWAPFGVGVVILLLAPVVMRLFGVTPQLVGGVSSGPAPDIQSNIPPATPDLSGVHLGVFATVLIMAALAWILRKLIVGVAVRVDPNLQDPWLRIEAERRHAG